MSPPAVSDQRTLFLANTFVIHTVRLLNNFSAICEQKLLHVHRRLSRLDATLALLEAKLQSVEGLDRLDRQAVVQSQESQLPIPTLTTATPLLDHEIDEAGSTSSIGVPQNIVESAHQDGDISYTSLPSKDQPTVLKVKDDPRYARFFRMLQVGVPGAAVKIQMSAEGLDASLLDTPDAPSS
ncbi:unnamed protein product [Sphagnum balticum]